MNRRQIAAAAGITAALVLAGCGTAATTGGGTPHAAPHAASTAPAQPARNTPGTAVTVTAAHLDGTPWYTMRITLDRVAEPAPPDPATAMPDGSNLSAAPSGKHLAAAWFTWVTTASDDEGGLAPSSLLEFSARGSDGFRYTSQLGIGAGHGVDSAHPLAGERASGSVPFAVPDGVRVVSVTYSPLGGGTEVTWLAGS